MIQEGILPCKEARRSGTETRGRNARESWTLRSREESSKASQAARWRGESGWDHLTVRDSSWTKWSVMHCSSEEEIFRLISICFESQGMTQEGPGIHHGSSRNTFTRYLWMTGPSLHRSIVDAFVYSGRHGQGKGHCFAASLVTGHQPM